MNDAPLPETNAEIASLMREKLGIGGKDRLAVKMRRGGRLLPRRLRQEAAELTKLETLWPNPRLRRQIDPALVQRYQDNLRTHLKAIDVKDRFKGRVIGILVSLAFNFLLLFALIMGWLVWSGRI